MSKMPAFQFYPADWRKDPGVQSLSWADRGVWIEILCLMHESPRRGVLLMPSGAPMTSVSLSRIIGLPMKQTVDCLERLVESGVASREMDSGALLNRRMVRDEESRKKQGQSGKTGGSPALCENYNEPGFVYAIQRPEGSIKIGIARNPTNRLYKLRYTLKEEGLEMLATLPVEDMGKEEKALHVKYAQWCVGGEWFDFPEEVKGELLSTLKGEDKGDQRASPSPSTSPSTSVREKKESLSEIPKKSKRAPKDFTVSDANRLWAISRGFNDSVISEETAAFLDHEYKNPRSDWPAAWRNWFRNKDKFQGNGNGKQNIETRGELLIRRQKEELDRALGGATGDGFGSDDPGRTGALVRSRTVGSDG